MSDALGKGSTEVSKGFASSNRLAKGCVLVVVDGPNAGSTFDVDGAASSRVFVGQSKSCDIRLEDPQVSRRHAALETSNAGVRLQDLNSTNGTFVNGLRVFDALIVGGETLRFGATTLRVESLTEVPPPSSEADRFGNTLGRSAVMRRLYSHCEKLARAMVPVLIEGETGTGKEVLAESLHDASSRRDGPFVVLDCTTIAPSLAEATIFGHERGAFTGAVTSHPGVFEEAHGGTLFIDEIGDLEMSLQAKLLRAIERGEVRRVGGSRVVKVDVRILSATRRNIEKEIQDGRFRDDLYFRLAVGRIELPPLRRREGDVAFLAQTFARKFSEADGGGKHVLGDDLLERLEAYPFPGNVRELRNLVVQHLALGALPSLDATAVTVGAPNEGPIGNSETSEPGDDFERVLARDLPFFSARDAIARAFEHHYLVRVLAQHGGHVGNAAAAAGIGRRYFQRIRNRAKDESEQ